MHRGCEYLDRTQSNFYQENMGRERKTLEPCEAIENTIGMAENAIGSVFFLGEKHDGDWFFGEKLR